MAQSGMTRRIDELGRIVIPKEIRKNLKIRDSDELDISLDGNRIVLNKHEVVDRDRIIINYLFVLNKFIKKDVFFTSRDKILEYFLNNKKSINNLELSSEIIHIIDNRKAVVKENKDFSFSNDTYILISPIIINGDLIGSLIIGSNEEISLLDQEIIKFSKTFFENYLE